MPQLQRSLETTFDDWLDQLAEEVQIVPSFEAFAGAHGFNEKEVEAFLYKTDLNAAVEQEQDDHDDFE